MDLLERVSSHAAHVDPDEALILATEEVRAHRAGE
jgi:hypothetical protein